MIQNGKNTPLNAQGGTLPNVGGALQSWFQPMAFGVVTKEVVGHQLVETVATVQTMGVIQPLNARELVMKPDGQSAWTWFQLHALPGLVLNVDDIVTYLETPTRVMARKDFTAYGYVEYHLVQDWT